MSGRGRRAARKAASRGEGSRSLPIAREFVGGEPVYRLGRRRITGAREIERLNALAIPPAWKEVEIARSRSAKVQARGVDAAGRTQAIYHPAFRRRRERQKFDRLTRFAEALPGLRARVDRDLRRRSLSRDRVVAGVVRLIDRQFFRVGNTAYARSGSFGVTTVRREHVRVSTEALLFDFAGKSGRRHRRRVRDPRVARLVARLMELPGPEVFRFFDEDGLVHRLDSRHVNAYVKQHMGEEFSAKDFRTWGGTLIAASRLFELGPEELRDARTAEAARREAVRAAAEQLGNTVAVARESYIDPRVLDAFERPDTVERVRRARVRSRRHLSAEEQRALLLLRGWSKGRKKSGRGTRADSA